MKEEILKKNNRQSNIEILRILAILLIISFHYVYHSDFTYESLNYNTFVVKLFYFFGELGVNLFMLITGYFMVNGKFKLKKLLLILAEVLFYYLLITLFGISIGVFDIPASFKDKFLMFFPTILSKNWFITVYVIIYILSPYLNIFIKNISKKEYKKFLGIVLLLWCVIPTFLGIFYNTSESILYYSRFIWMLIIYFVGAYIRLYGFNILNTNKKRILCVIGTFIIMLVSIIYIYVLRVQLGKLGLYELAYFWTPNNILMFLLSISVFGLFLSLKVKNNQIINFLASTTLGIYLIHDGELRQYIWKTIFKAKEHLLGHFPIGHILLSTLIIFFVGVLIDLVRQLIEKYTLSRFIDYISKKYATSKNDTVEEDN